MRYEVKTKISIVNNFTEENMGLLYFNTRKSDVCKDDFWTYLCEDIINTYDGEKQYLYEMFTEDAPIAVRIELAISDNSNYVSNPTLCWDLSPELIKNCEEDAINAELLIFRKYLEQMIRDIESRTLHKHAFTDILPGCVFSPETRIKFIKQKLHSGMKQPYVRANVTFDANPESPAVFTIPIEHVKGFDMRFGKPYVKNYVFQHLMLYVNTLPLDTVHNVTIDMRMWGDKKTFTASVEHLQDDGELLADMVGKVILGYYNGTDNDKPASKFSGAINKMKD